MCAPNKIWWVYSNSYAAYIITLHKLEREKWVVYKSKTTDNEGNNVNEMVIYATVVPKE